MRSSCGRIISLLAPILIGGLLFPVFAFAQKSPEQEGLDINRRHLILITKRSLVLEKELEELMKKSSSDEVMGKIMFLQAQKDMLQLDFDSIATQISLDVTAAKDKKKTDWLEEMQELTKPLLQAVRDLTEKPRKIDALKKRIEGLETQLETYEKAYKNIATLRKAEGESPSAQTPEGAQYLARLKHLHNKYDPELIRLNLSKAKKNLVDELSEDESFVDTATRQFKDFVRHRGRNLLVVTLTFFGIWWVLSMLRKWIVDTKILAKLSPELHKVVKATYNGIVLILCFIASVVCLYIFNDWLLISLLAVVLFVVAWTSRQWVPKFLREIKIIVNLGTVKEKERLIWQGVPWLIREIGLNAKLVNERLEGGEVKLQIHELFGMHSRPVVDNEPWFPTEKGDWVILGDETYGKVENQTMEQVVLSLKGGALKYYSAAEFLNQAPVNISEGFRYAIEFGLDYGVQSRVCDELPSLFEEGIKRRLAHHFQDEEPDFTYLEVSFDHAGSSSLNLIIIIHVEGRCADRHEENQREIQTALVMICNENGLVIPFNRLTINLADKNSHPEEQALPLPDSAPEDRV